LPSQSKALLSELTSLFDIQVLVWFREPVAFAESYYKQCIRNPQVASNPCYGKDLSFSQMLDIKWFNQHLDYRGFVQECKEVFGNSTVSVFKYSGDVVQEVINLLGLSTPHDNPTPRRNISLNSATIEMIRIINRANLKAKEKELLIPHLRSINELMENYKDKGFVNTETRKKVLALARPL
ncbi:MAG: sulfotransferase family protein, partial [Paraglaciecola sp.]